MQIIEVRWALFSSTFLRKSNLVEPGERIAQLLFAPVTRGQLVEVDVLSETERGRGGFGSTGVK